MSKVIETTVYEFNELSEEAKEKAREWYRADDSEPYWTEFVYDEFVRVCAILGVELDTYPVKLYGGGTRQKPCIWWSGFYNQGDGACFEGRYRFVRGAPRGVRKHLPKDTELHRIADSLQEVQRRNFYQIYATVKYRGHYHHEYNMNIAVERDDAAMTPDAAKTIAEALRDLARWLYRQLESEYEYRNSNEIVDESILANEYTFTEDGKRFG